jgi:hypothetical protein
MKELIAKLFEPRFSARYIGRHRAPSALLSLPGVTRNARAAAPAA